MQALQLLILLFITSATLSMQQSPVFKLDKKGLAEFRDVKKRMVELAANAKISPENRLLKSYKQLAENSR